MASEASPLKRAAQTVLVVSGEEVEDGQEEEEEEEEEYIDMDVSSSTFLCYTFASPPPPPLNEDFEFRLSSFQTDAIASPADELFYKGNLLPLLLPPRLQMLEKLLRNHTEVVETKSCQDGEPFNLSSPFSSCYVSGELTHEEIMHQYYFPMKRWFKKLKFIKGYKLGHKLKASGSYVVKSLFAKSHVLSMRKGKNKKPTRKKGSGDGDDEKVVDGVSSGKEEEGNQINAKRVSISGVDGGGSPLLRSRSSRSEEERSIQRAIAYCKSSHEGDKQRKSLGDERW